MESVFEIQGETPVGEDGDDRQAFELTAIQCGVEPDWLDQAVAAGLPDDLLEKGMDAFGGRDGESLKSRFGEVLQLWQEGNLEKVLEERKKRKVWI